MNVNVEDLLGFWKVTKQRRKNGSTDFNFLRIYLFEFSLNYYFILFNCTLFRYNSFIYLDDMVSIELF